MLTQISAMTPEQLAISPGVGAFATFFFLAVALGLLAMNMSKHLRKVDRHRIEQEVRQEMAAEKEAAQAASENARQAKPDSDSAQGD